MKKLQALYNDDANKIVKQAMREKSTIKNSNSLMTLFMVTNNTKPLPHEPQAFNKTWDHSNKDSQKMVRSNLQQVHRHEQATTMV